MPFTAHDIKFFHVYTQTTRVYPNKRSNLINRLQILVQMSWFFTAILLPLARSKWAELPFSLHIFVAVVWYTLLYKKPNINGANTLLELWGTELNIFNGRLTDLQWNFKRVFLPYKINRWMNLFKHLIETLEVSLPCKAIGDANTSSHTVELLNDCCLVSSSQLANSQLHFDVASFCHTNIPLFWTLHSILVL